MAHRSYSVFSRKFLLPFSLVGLATIFWIGYVFALSYPTIPDTLIGQPRKLEDILSLILNNPLTWQVKDSQKLGGIPASSYQKRIVASCSGANVIKSINEDGSVNCWTVNRIVSCTNLPQNASWNTASSITQLRSGGNWSPSQVGIYGTTSSTTNCVFACNGGFKWNGSSCITEFTYSWITGNPSTCSATCGGGTQARTVSCQRSDWVLVSDSFCTLPKPSETLSCNTQDCPNTLDALVIGFCSYDFGWCWNTGRMLDAPPIPFDNDTDCYSAYGGYGTKWGVKGYVFNADFSCSDGWAHFQLFCPDGYNGNTTIVNFWKPNWHYAFSCDKCSGDGCYGRWWMVGSCGPDDSRCRKPTEATNLDISISENGATGTCNEYYLGAASWDGRSGRIFPWSQDGKNIISCSSPSAQFFCPDGTYFDSWTFFCKNL